MPMTALTGFTDGVVVHQGDLANLSTNTNTLCSMLTNYYPSDNSTGRRYTKAILSGTNNQAIQTALLTPIAFDFALMNVGNMYISVAPSGGAQISFGGWYRIEAQAAFDVGAQSERRVAIAINGTADSNITAQSNTQMSTANGVNNNQRIQVTSLEHVITGTTVSVLVYQNSGATINTLSTAKWGTWLTITFEAPY